MDAVFNFALAAVFGGLGLVFAAQSKREATEPDPAENAKAKRTRLGAILCYVATGLLILAGIIELVRS